MLRIASATGHSVAEALIFVSAAAVACVRRKWRRMRRPASADDGAARRQRHGRRCRRCSSARAPPLFDVSELFMALVGADGGRESGGRACGRGAEAAEGRVGSGPSAPGRGSGRGGLTGAPRRSQRFCSTLV